MKTNDTSTELTFNNSTILPSNHTSSTASTENYALSHKTHMVKNRHGRNPRVTHEVVTFENADQVKRKLTHNITQGIKTEIQCETKHEAAIIEQVCKSLLKAEELHKASKHITITCKENTLWNNFKSGLAPVGEFLSNPLGWLAPKAYAKPIEQKTSENPVKSKTKHNSGVKEQQSKELEEISTLVDKKFTNFNFAKLQSGEMSLKDVENQKNFIKKIVMELAQNSPEDKELVIKCLNEYEYIGMKNEGINFNSRYTEERPLLQGAIIQVESVTDVRGFLFKEGATVEDFRKICNDSLLYLKLKEAVTNKLVIYPKEADTVSNWEKRNLVDHISNMLLKLAIKSPESAKLVGECLQKIEEVSFQRSVNPIEGPPSEGTVRQGSKDGKPTIHFTVFATENDLQETCDEIVNPKPNVEKHEKSNTNEKLVKSKTKNNSGVSEQQLKELEERLKISFVESYALDPSGQIAVAVDSGVRNHNINSLLELAQTSPKYFELVDKLSKGIHFISVLSEKHIPESHNYTKNPGNYFLNIPVEVKQGKYTLGDGAYAGTVGKQDVDTWRIICEGVMSDVTLIGKMILTKTYEIYPGETDTKIMGAKEQEVIGKSIVDVVQKFIQRSPEDRELLTKSLDEVKNIVFQITDEPILTGNVQFRDGDMMFSKFATADDLKKICKEIVEQKANSVRNEDIQGDSFGKFTSQNPPMRGYQHTINNEKNEKKQGGIAYNPAL